MKTAWLLCHDSYMDHRVYFFDRVLRECDIKTQMFAGPLDVQGYFGFSPERIIRPEISDVVWDFNKGAPSYDDFKDENELLFAVFSFCATVTHLKETPFSDSQFAKQFETEFRRHSPIGSLCKAIARNGDFYVRFQVFGWGHWFEYRSSNSLLTRSKPTLLSENSNFTSEQSHFCNSVYDYRPIWARVEAGLKSGELTAPDLIYVADLPMAQMALILSKKFGSKLIIDCHEWWIEQFKIWGNGSETQFQNYDRYEREIYPQADLRITVGSELAKDMVDYYGCQFNCIYSCDSIGSEDFQKQDGFWKKFIPDYAGEKIALFQGSMTVARNLDLLAQMTKTLPSNVKLVVAGAGAYLPEFMRILKEKGNPKRVVYLGWQTQETLLEITQNAHVGVIPYTPQKDSRYYSVGVPSKLFEYISARLPILYDRSMLEIHHIVDTKGFGASITMKNPAEAGVRVGEFANNDQWLQQCQENYKLNGPFFFYQGQKAEFLKVLSQLN